MANTTFPCFDDLVWALKQLQFEERLEQNLTDVQKLEYLKDTLVGNAGICMKELANTDDNYPRAWEIIRSLKENELVCFLLENFAPSENNSTVLLTEAVPSLQQYLQPSDGDSFSIESMLKLLRNCLSHEAKLLTPLNKMVKALINVMELNPEQREALLDIVKCRKLIKELSLLEKLIWISPFPNKTSRNSWEVHGFSSASENTLGAVVYIRYRRYNQYVVSPISAIARELKKQDIDSEARLELCGAELLAEIIKDAVSKYDLQGVPIHLWTHCASVFEWMHRGSSWWKEYVESKVKSIQDLTPEAHWYHVPNYLNPACAASDGLTPEDLRKCTIWFSGPPYLHDIKFNPNKLPRATKTITTDNVKVEENPFVRYYRSLKQNHLTTSTTTRNQEKIEKEE